jgi:hypothetical protein
VQPVNREAAHPAAEDGESAAAHAAVNGHGAAWRSVLGTCPVCSEFHYFNENDSLGLFDCGSAEFVGSLDDLAEELAEREGMGKPPLGVINEVLEWVAPVKAGSSWQPVDLLGILSGEGDDEQPAVLAVEGGGRLCYPRRVNALYGEPESIKTWVALVACAQALLAGLVVVFIDYEDSPRAVVQRLRALGVPDDVIAARFVYIQPGEPIAAGETNLDAALARGPSLVVLDGVTEAMTVEGLSLKDNGEVAQFYSRTPRRIARCGAAVLLIDHVTKSREERGRYAIGAQAKLAGLDGAAYVVKMVTPFGRGRTGRARLLLTKDRQGWVKTEGKDRRAAEVEAISDEERVTIRLTAPVPAEAFRPTFLMERISRELEARTEPASGKALRDAVKGKTDAKLAALEILVTEHYVTTEPGKRGAVLHRSVRPYRKDGDLSHGSGEQLADSGESE